MKSENKKNIYTRKVTENREIHIHKFSEKILKKSAIAILKYRKKKFLLVIFVFCEKCKKRIFFSFLF